MRPHPVRTVFGRPRVCKVKWTVQAKICSPCTQWQRCTVIPLYKPFQGHALLELYKNHQTMQGKKNKKKTTLVPNGISSGWRKHNKWRSGWRTWSLSFMGNMAHWCPIDGSNLHWSLLKIQTIYGWSYEPMNPSSQDPPTCNIHKDTNRTDGQHINMPLGLKICSTATRTLLKKTGHKMLKNNITDGHGRWRRSSVQFCLQPAMITFEISRRKLVGFSWKAQSEAAFTCV